MFVLTFLISINSSKFFQNEDQKNIQKVVNVQIIYNRNGQKLGLFIPQEGNRWLVKNNNDQVVGYFDNATTYDANNNVVAHGKIPGILLCR